MKNTVQFAYSTILLLSDIAQKREIKKFSNKNNPP